MASQVATLTPNTTAQPQLGWQAKSANINNQSNCWLTYNGQYIISPYQQSVYPFPSGDTAPSLSLTSTAPAGQQNQPAPTGTCYVTLSDQVQQANPGVVSANLLVQSNQTLLATIHGNNGQVINQSVNIPSSIQTLIVTATGVGAFGTVVTVTGASGLVYFQGSVNANALPLTVIPILPAFDSSVTVGFTGGVNGVDISLIGLPVSEVTDISGNVNVTLTNVTAPAFSVDVLGPQTLLASGITANGTTTFTPNSQGAIQSITVLNAGAGSCTVELVGVTSGFQFLTPTALATQASLTADVWFGLDTQFNLIITAKAGVISVAAVGNPYPAQAAGGSSSTSKAIIVFRSNGVNAGATDFIPPGGNLQTIEANAQVSVPAGTWKGAFCFTDTAPGAGQSIVMTIRNNGAPTGVTATLTTATTAQDLTNTFTTANADLLSCRCVASAGIAANNNFTCVLEGTLT